MTAEQQAGAASRNTVDWQAIDWPKVHRNARRLQAREVAKCAILALAGRAAHLEAVSLRQ
jgi:hypothetical protein